MSLRRKTIQSLCAISFVLSGPAMAADAGQAQYKPKIGQKGKDVV